ncbi:DUF7059 domain-containing protein [Arthrobacter roseus]|uniref:DUF7059 domain-containing protein n=1 Tax=Arthrobacter roseus TaxID=136274 RepID=UPI001965CB50|nr:class I SAM-dependent methyltransferase [Arthrobacter roseus]MBM7849535.1 methylase of polypeptide subunit release factors [Arthrobacter roseus]
MNSFTEDVPDAPNSASAQLLAALATDLQLVDFTVDGVASMLGEEASQALDREQPIPAKLRCRVLIGGSGAEAVLAVVVLLWLLGDTVTEEDLANAFKNLTVDTLLELRLVERSDDGLRAAVDLRPYSSDADGDLWVASDLGFRQRAGVLRHDHVLGIGQASLTLAQVTMRTPVQTALDLGTGCGIQTFHLLSHVRHVTATDISSRALAFTRFNLLLNAHALNIDPTNTEDRVTLLQGNLLDAVAGQTFDLVVSNPPFVITPRSSGESADSQYTYRDGGLPGDQIVASLLQKLPDLLNPGGSAQMLGNWEISENTSWEERVASWVPDAVDAWVIQREAVSPSHYAETWLRDAAENREPAAYEAAFAAYLEDFASRNVSSIGFGMVWLRNPAVGKRTLNRFEDITHDVEQPLGAHLQAAVERSDWLTLNSSDLESQHLQVADDVTEERHQRPGAEHPGVILLRQGAGLRRTNLMSTELTGFVSASDGELAVGQIIGALAALLDRDDAAFRSGLSEEVRNLVRDGFLTPVP